MKKKKIVTAQRHLNMYFQSPPFSSFLLKQSKNKHNNLLSPYEW